MSFDKNSEKLCDYTESVRKETSFHTTAPMTSSKRRRLRRKKKKKKEKSKRKILAPPAESVKPQSLHSGVNPEQIREDALKRLKEKRAAFRKQRTGENFRNLKKNIPKTNQKNIQRNLRKNGARAVMDQLGISDPEIEALVNGFLRSGQLQDEQSLLAKISSLVAKKEAQEIESNVSKRL